MIQGTTVKILNKLDDISAIAIWCDYWLFVNKTSNIDENAIQLQVWTWALPVGMALAFHESYSAERQGTSHKIMGKRNDPGTASCVVLLNNEVGLLSSSAPQRRQPWSSPSSEVSKGLPDRGGWREEILPVPEIQASFLQPFSYSSLRRRWTQFWGQFLLHLAPLSVTNPIPPTPFRTSDFSHFENLGRHSIDLWSLACRQCTDGSVSSSPNRVSLLDATTTILDILDLMTRLYEGTLTSSGVTIAGEFPTNMCTFKNPTQGATHVWCTSYKLKFHKAPNSCIRGSSYPSKFGHYARMAPSWTMPCNTACALVRDESPDVLINKPLVPANYAPFRALYLRINLLKQASL